MNGTRRIRSEKLRNTSIEKDMLGILKVRKKDEMKQKY